MAQSEGEITPTAIVITGRRSSKWCMCKYSGELTEMRAKDVWMRVRVKRIVWVFKFGYIVLVTTE